MFGKGKRESRHSEDDVVFNRMLFWLVGAVVLELLLLLLQKAYVNMIFGSRVAEGLLIFFRIFNIAGVILTVGGAIWAVLNRRSGGPMVIPLAVAGGAAVLWIISLVSYFLYADGIRALLMLPAAAAVLIIIFFLYQRAFFYDAILTGGGLLALWLFGRYYMVHPRFVTGCFIGGWVVLAVVAALTFRLRKNDGKLGGIRVMPVDSNYLITWITCGIVALVTVLALILGVAAAQWLLYALVAWLFAQAVFFTVKMM